jgi:hypothetical protein
MKRTDDSLWESTAGQNLFRYRPSGTFFARFKVGGKPIRQSLETSVFSVAKQRLPDKIREYRSRHESIKSVRHWENDRWRCCGSVSPEDPREDFS